MPVSSVEDMFKQFSSAKTEETKGTEETVGGKRRGRRSVRKSKSPVRRSKSPVKKVKKATGGAKKSPVRRSKSPVRRSKSPVKRAKKGKKGGVVDLSPFLASLLLLGTTLKFSKKGKKGTKRWGGTPQDEENERVNAELKKVRNIDPEFAKLMNTADTNESNAYERAYDVIKTNENTRAMMEADKADKADGAQGGARKSRSKSPTRKPCARKSRGGNQEEEQEGGKKRRSKSPAKRKPRARKSRGGNLDSEPAEPAAGGARRKRRSKSPAKKLSRSKSPVKRTHRRRKGGDNEMLAE